MMESNIGIHIPLVSIISPKSVPPHKASKVMMHKSAAHQLSSIAAGKQRVRSLGLWYSIASFIDVPLVFIHVKSGADDRLQVLIHYSAPMLRRM